MRFLMDVGVGKPSDDYLISTGHDVKTVRKMKADMSDEEILSIAVAEERIVITMDKDFGELVFGGSAKHCGVLLLRTEEMNGQEKSKVIKYILENHLETLAHNFCVFQNGKLRIHGRQTG